jgi:NAD(P)-dependent dehydrogenase (short-subunit alcohol dehydrogenase family)
VAITGRFANPASIILNASINANIGMPNTSVYGATKAALLSLARTLSGEFDWARNPCECGQPRTDRHTALRQAGALGSEFRSCVGVAQKPGTGAAFRQTSGDCKRGAVLASDESAFTVGSELIVDGGLGL